MIVAGLLLGISTWIYILYKKETSSLEFKFGSQINNISSELNNFDNKTAAHSAQTWALLFPFLRLKVGVAAGKPNRIVW